MELTRKERSVVQLLRRKRIATLAILCHELTVSRMTVVRALNKHGYHSSVNHNASYYTLRDLPRFDEDGLWSYRGVCFSKHGSLAQTLLALAQNSPAGSMVRELEKRVQTRVGNLLSRLCRERKLSRCFVGHEAVYMAVDDERRQQQQEERERRQRELQASRGSSAADRLDLPPRYDVATVLEVLIQVIKTPRANAAQIGKALRGRGLKINTVQVQQVLEFYALQKKRHTGRGGAGTAAGA